MTEIMVVEDDDAVALVVEALLTRENFVVRRAVDAAQAQDLVAEQAGGPDLLLADVTLPGPCDGIALARRLRVDRAGLPVVLMSGTFEEGAPAPDGLGGAVLLPKPFRRADLLAALSAAFAAMEG